MEYGPAQGQLDVWIPVKNLSEITGVGEELIRKTLKEQHPARKTWKNECWLRLGTVEQANALVAQLKKWMPQAANAANA